VRLEREGRYNASRQNDLGNLGEAMRVWKRQIITTLLGLALMSLGGNAPAYGQNGAADGKDNRGVRPVTIPITIRQRGSKAESELQATIYIVKEDGDPQQVISVRDYTFVPLTVQVLIQDDVVPSIANEIQSIAKFIRRLPKGSRVFVGYIGSGSLRVQQKFTSDLERAAKSLRVPIGTAGAAPFNPYVEIIEGLKRFDSQPSGRRAMLVVSDGLDTSHGLDSSSPGQSIDLERAIKDAQRRSVAIYSFYAPTVTFTARGNQVLVGNAQGSLQKLSDETGGRAFFQGTGAPVSFDPFLTELATSLSGQLALTYLSTHPEKGYHRIKIVSERKDIEIDHPAGYTRK
jgi:VWFA-related protein